MCEALPFPEDYQLAQRCLDRDEAAARTLLKTHHDKLVSVAIARGIPHSQAEDTVNQLWAEAIRRDGGRPGRLAGYNGQCQLSTFLNTVVFHLWLTEHRKRERRAAIEEREDGPRHDSGIAGTRAAALPTDVMDDPLIELLTSAIEAGAKKCSAEQFVLVQLFHMDRLRGRELARMFGCHEPKISTVVKSGREAWFAGIEEYVQMREPNLTLRLEDFLELCSVVTPRCLGLDN